MKILNLYAGLGGNRKYWSGDITAVESNQKIAAQYKKFYPDDTLVIGDAHQYLLDHYQEYDFIWSSPPCQSHSRMIRSGKNRKPRYPDMKLYEEIIFLHHNRLEPWIIENVAPYYEPLRPPTGVIGRHCFWTNFPVPEIKEPKPDMDFINEATVKGSEILKKWLGLEYEGNIYYEGNHCPAQVLRNCVHPDIGKAILDMGRVV